ncbi:GapA-binding peptide SR1P [Domibacillus aminovorans]|nr:GapA-binding peptide SR1P [Domibacillus aminovorans]
MGTIICTTCLKTIEYFEEEKVTVLYSHCGCDHKTETENDK